MEESDVARETPEPGVAPVNEAEYEDPPSDDLDDVASYEDGDSLVICDRKNAKAWIESDAATTLEP